MLYNNNEEISISSVAEFVYFWTQFFKKSAVSSICIYLHTFDPELLRVTTLHHDDWLRIVLSILSCSRVTAL